MVRRPLSSALMASAALALAAAFSCKTFDLPAETCDPQTLDSKRDPGQSDDDCSRCLEDNCCDFVGRCERQGGCAPLVHDAQKCVLAAKLKGATLESDCAKRLPEIKEADDAYRCMRSACGAQCGLPVCKVDKAALLIRNAKCDGCFTGGCCAPLNRCYENRACKLMLECIINRCGSELGPALKERTGGPPDGAVEGPGGVATLCDRAPQNVGIPECLRTCLCTYRDNDPGLPPPDVALLPVNLAYSVYACGKEAECGEVCSLGPDDDAGGR